MGVRDEPAPRLNQGGVVSLAPSRAVSLWPGVPLIEPSPRMSAAVEVASRSSPFWTSLKTSCPSAEVHSHLILSLCRGRLVPWPSQMSLLAILPHRTRVLLPCATCWCSLSTSTLCHLVATQSLIPPFLEQPERWSVGQSFGKAFKCFIALLLLLYYYYVTKVKQ